jgi:GR25 family glycosyltransferase involved in LPS biosynthesis
MEMKYLMIGGLFFLIIVGILFIMRNSNKDSKREKEPKKTKDIDINQLLKYHYYINLDYRTDKNKQNIEELKKIGIYNPNRFSAIKKDNGVVGCYMSHIEVLKLARKKKWPYVTVFEDDVLFLKPEDTLKKLNRIINSNIKWDVIILGGQNGPPYEEINSDCIKVSNCQSTTSYLVKQSYYDTLINHWEKGLDLLIKTNDRPLYAIDIYWKILQKKDNFLAIIPMDVIQYPGYSDIDKMEVDWTEQLIDYKTAF